MTVIVRVARSMAAKELQHLALVLIGVMISTVSILMFAHAVEVDVRALEYGIVDVTPPDAGRVYFAFVNCTTLGYCDIIPAKRWQLLGPITAMNGVLLFGWSTAVIFEVLRRTMQIEPAASG